MSKIRLDIELDTAKALFELIHKTINKKTTHPDDQVALAMLGVDLADKIWKHQLVIRMSGAKQKEETKILNPLFLIDSRD